MFVFDLPHLWVCKCLIWHLQKLLSLQFCCHKFSFVLWRFLMFVRYLIIFFSTCNDHNNDPVTTVLQGENYLKLLSCNKFDKKTTIVWLILLNIYHLMFKWVGSYNCHGLYLGNSTGDESTTGSSSNSERKDSSRCGCSLAHTLDSINIIRFEVDWCIAVLTPY